MYAVRIRFTLSFCICAFFAFWTMQLNSTHNILFYNEINLHRIFYFKLILMFNYFIPKALLCGLIKLISFIRKFNSNIIIKL